MSGLDKVHILLPTYNNSTGPRLLLSTLLANARNFGYVHFPAGQKFKKPTFRLEHREPDYGYGNIYVEYQDIGSSRKGISVNTQYVRKVMFNPSRFDDTVSFREALVTIDQGRAIASAPINRLDFASDHPSIPEEFLLQIDVGDKQYSKVYWEAMSGEPETMYWGNTEDIVVVYNQTALLTSLDILSNLSEGTILRVERQIETPRAIKKEFKLSDNLNITELPSLMEAIGRGDHYPLRKIKLRTLTLPAMNTVSPEDAFQLGRMYQTALIGGVGLLRRSVSAHPLIRRAQIRDCAPELQPTTVLREAISGMLSDTGHRFDTVSSACG